MSKQEAADLAKKYGIDFNKDYFTLSTDKKLYLNDLKKTVGYSYKSPTGKSETMAFFESLKRLSK